MRVIPIIIILVIGLIASDCILFYEPNLYVKNKYTWYVHIANKQITISKELALQSINKAEKLNPDRNEAIRLKIVVFQSLDKHEVAQNSISQLKNDDPFYYYANGINMLNQENLIDAEKYLREGIEQFPDYAPNYYISAIVNFRLGNKEASYLRAINGLNKVNVSYQKYQYEKYIFIKKNEFIGLLLGIKEYISSGSIKKCKKYYPHCVISTRRNLNIH